MSTFHLAANRSDCARDCCRCRIRNESVGSVSSSVDESSYVTARGGSTHVALNEPGCSIATTVNAATLSRLDADGSTALMETRTSSEMGSVSACRRLHAHGRSSAPARDGSAVGRAPSGLNLDGCLSMSFAPRTLHASARQLFSAMVPPSQRLQFQSCHVAPPPHVRAASDRLHPPSRCVTKRSDSSQGQDSSGEDLDTQGAVAPQTNSTSSQNRSREQRLQPQSAILPAFGEPQAQGVSLRLAHAIKLLVDDSSGSRRDDDSAKTLSRGKQAGSFPPELEPTPQAASDRAMQGTR